MRKLRTSVLALTTVASLTIGGAAVANAADAPEANAAQSISAQNGSSNKGEGQEGSASNGSSNKGEGQEGSASNASSSTPKAESDNNDSDDNTKANDGSLNREKGWVPGHSFGSTLQTDYVPVWAKIWIAVVTVVGIITAGLFAAPGITAMKMHNIIPSFH